MNLAYCTGLDQTQAWQFLVQNDLFHLKTELQKSFFSGLGLTK